MKIPYKAALTPLLIAAAIFNVGCTPDQVESIQPLVNSFNESLNDPNGFNGLVDDDVDTPEEDLETPIGNEVLEPTGIISEVAIGDTQGVYFAGPPPEAIGELALQPLFVNDEPVQFISGGSTQVPLQSNNPFVTVYVVADSEGFFQIDLPAELTAADLIITYSTVQLDGDVADIGVQVASASGEISGAQQLPVTSVVVGTGDLQVSVSWNTQADVDLYLREPSGEVIFYADPSSDAGGVLDLDSNVECPAGDPQNENITYENVVPPAGEYLVSLDLFSNCGIVTTPTDFVVTVRIGDDVQTYTGTLSTDASIPYLDVATFEIR